MSESSFRAPRYWGVWLLIGLLTGVAKLPWWVQVKSAQALGGFLRVVAKRRRKIVDTNLRLCFPEWDEQERQKKVKEVFFHNALGFIEAANAYNSDTESLRKQVTIRGAEHLKAAQAHGRGVLLVGAHYSHLDLGGALVSLVAPVSAIYRPNDNPLMDHYIIKGRMGFMKAVIKRTDMRSIVKALKKNEVVWYPPDQDYGKEHAVYAPFFGVTAATITATSRLVKFNQTQVVMLSYNRDDSGHYHLEFSPAPEQFPSGDDYTDASLINSALEENIRKAPTQYMWTHRRFKNQPDNKKYYQ